MDPKTAQILLGAAGSGGAAQALYVDDVFSTYLYEGNGGPQTIANGIDLSGEGGLVWLKDRENGSDSSPEIHGLFDTERGATKFIQSDGANSQSTNTESLKTFNSNGFTLGTYNRFTESGTDYVSWTFRKAPGFFDVVTYTGNGTAGRTISHSLGSTPGMIMVKQTNGGNDWNVWHRSIPNTHYLVLNSTQASTNQSTFGINVWNSTTPTSTSFTVGNWASTNQNNQEYVAYIFAHDDQSFGTDEDEAVIKCGSYTGNTSTKPFIDLGFEPQWVMIKRTSDTDPWICFDNMRGIPTGQFSERLELNNSNAEDTFGRITLFPNGFESSYNTGFQNSNGETYIYMAIRRPHKPPSTGTDVFNPSTQVGTVPNFSTNFPVDFAIRLLHFGGNTTFSQMVVSRLTGERYMPTSQTNAEAAPSGFSIDLQHMDGWGDMGGLGTGLSFKRAPGFLDVVCYTGDGTSGRTINHNLGAIPEFWLFKRRDAVGSWTVGSSYLSNPTGDRLILNSDGAVAATGITAWTNTATTFLADYSGIYNASGGEYIAYFFASLSGISKVGTYSGTGNNIDVDCGFTAGARFIMIKRTDSAGDWFVFDSVRGIVSGNDPYMRLNSTGAQNSNSDNVDPLNSGFTVVAGAPSDLNANGGTYLFFAIA